MPGGNGAKRSVLGRQSVLLNYSGSGGRGPKKHPRHPGAAQPMNRVRQTGAQSGLTLIELILACSILLVLSTAALPVLKYTVIRSKEYELHRDLREIRNAIDRYKDLADRNLIRVEVGSEGYPPDLDTLVQGVQYVASGQQKKRFLRRIPMDPMTGRAEWNLQSVQDDPDSHSWGGNNVFDVHSKSQGTALDGTKYSEW